ncbi:MAG: ABC transporter substrate-binding protein [Alphaproteobacteria bacterium]|nr:ABC transporter substrate-binding protein [Alphaproteobacteria bacterium]
MKIYFYCVLLLGSIILQTQAQTSQSNTSLPTHGVSTFGKLKYPADFKNYEYVNPSAPKGGSLRLGSMGSFNSLNPYIVKGTPPAIILLTTATLLEEARDRAAESYGYTAESVERAPDNSWVIFRLNPKATFSNGDPITADDVIWVFETLRDKGAPMYRTYYKNVSKTEKLDPHTIKFSFNTTSNRELPLILGQLPILSKKYYMTHPFTETSLEPSPSSGPYVVESMPTGRSIVLKRVKNWWGESVPSQKGRHNFDTIKVDYYLENNALFEGFKSGQYDLRVESIAKNWVTAYTFPACQQNLIKREELKYSTSSGSVGLIFNTRRPIFSDIRVRKALTLLFNFPWINKHLFYDLYQRNTSYFPNSDFEATGLPTQAEKNVLKQFQTQLPPEIFNEPFSLPNPQGEEDYRMLQEQAQNLLKEAGYEIKDHVMTNVKTGAPFVFEALIYDKSLEKIFLNFAVSLKRLGIELKLRNMDPAAYQVRADNLDFDMIYVGIGQSPNPGNEQRDYFGTEKANTPGTQNYAGIQNPIVDKLIEILINSKSYSELVTNVKTLDRVLLSGYYMIPAWHSGVVRLAYWDRLSKPSILPKYIGFDMTTWWFDAEKDKKLKSVAAQNNVTNGRQSSIWKTICSWFS